MASSSWASKDFAFSAPSSWNRAFSCRVVAASVRSISGSACSGPNSCSNGCSESRSVSTVRVFLLPLCQGIQIGLQGIPLDRSFGVRGQHLADSVLGKPSGNQPLQPCLCPGVFPAGCILLQKSFPASDRSVPLPASVPLLYDRRIAPF